MKLRKLVRKMSKVPTQDEVHDVRTNTRRLEATLEALQLDRKRKGRRVLAVVTPIRKKAGDVRDMDVLTGFASTLPNDGADTCLVRLLEHLGEERTRGASRLVKTVAKRRKPASKRLKACSTMIEKQFDNQDAKQQREWPLDATAGALRIAGELANWPKLSARNLHPFRLKVKELRYILQLDGENTEFTDRLGEIKDQIGEWHDWEELIAITREELKKKWRAPLLAEMTRIADNKFQEAIRAAHELRSTRLATCHWNGSPVNLKAVKKPELVRRTLAAAA